MIRAALIPAALIRTAPIRALRRARTGLVSAVRGPRVARRRALVEEFHATRVTGWVKAPQGAPATRVALFVNDTEVMATSASARIERAPEDAVQGFTMEVRDLWQFCRREDQVCVRIEGARIPIAGHGLWLTPAADGGRDLRALREELAAGRVFGRSGRLRLSKTLDTTWQQTVMALYGRTREVLSAELGYDAFLMYGTLLGAVREGGPIGHDHDLDAAYVSRHTDPGEVARELQRVAFLLIEEGLDVQCRHTTLHIHDADDPHVRIDLFHLFFNRRGTLCFPYGAAGTTSLRRGDWPGVREIEFLGRPALVPVAAEQLVEVLYGSTWRRPVPGFRWRRDRRVAAPAARLPLLLMDEVHWANFYARHDLDTGSAFLAHVQAQPDLPGTVVDLGCGAGRDSLAFAGAGRTVLGLDRSHMGIRRAAEKAESSGLADRLSFTVGDVGDVPALTAMFELAREGADGSPVLFYARFLLHAVPEDVQETLLGVIRDSARPGDWFAAEFRTTEDEAVSGVPVRRYRRLQDGPALGRRLAEVFGFEVVQEQAGTGLSPYRGEDPELYRVLARRR